jgi:carbon-monoxide dehydrogenase large subunit
MERLVDAAARQTGIDGVTLRRRNFTPPDAMPYATAVGATIDSGEFEAILDRALALAEHAAFEERRRASASDGKLRGLGLSCFLEHSGGLGLETGDVAFTGPESITFSLGGQSTGPRCSATFSRSGLRSRRSRSRSGKAIQTSI